MYNTTSLLSAIDSLVESAKGRLNENELQLLAYIRAAIEEYDNSDHGDDDDDKLEQSWINFFRLLLVIKDFIEKVT